MAKGWTQFATINKLIPEDKNTNKRNLIGLNNLIHNTKHMTMKDLLKEGDEMYQRKCAEDAFLMQGFKDKKLKSKELIHKANNKKKAKNNNQ